jgi:hypothetical protein
VAATAKDVLNKLLTDLDLDLDMPIEVVVVSCDKLERTTYEIKIEDIKLSEDNPNCIIIEV